MDTLADLASMQHHQPPPPPQQQQQQQKQQHQQPQQPQKHQHAQHSQRTARQNAPNMLRNAEFHQSQLSPSTIHPHVNQINHNTPTPRTSFDLAMAEGPRETAQRNYVQTSLEPEAQLLATELFNKIQENPHTYDAHVQFIGLLHAGFVNHVYPPNNPDIHGDPRRYDLLKDLRTAREEMDKLFAMGEDLWAEWIQDESMLAHTVMERTSVMELCQRSVEEEFGCTKLWHIYGEWVLYLYNATTGEHGAGQWTEEDRMIGREVFTWQTVLDVWQRAAEATQWRINNSHLVWDRFLELLTQDLSRGASQEKINHLRGLYEVRLQTPHATWDQTFQSFSSFISSYFESSYEEIMSETVAQASAAKNFYAAREEFEHRLAKAQDSGDKSVEWNLYREYIDWELCRNRRRREFHFELVNAVYQRAVLRFPTDVSLWEDYVMFLIGESMHGHASTTTISTLDRATRHCPWSGNLWSQYLLSSEREGQSFSKISGIKHRATSTGLLDAGGMEEVLKVHTTWCSYLRRRAFLSDATDEDLDVAEVGIRSAIESVQELGEKKYGRSYQGDPHFRLERIYIRYLSESGSWDSARETFKGLVPRRGDSYEFWLTYYNWELVCWSKFVQGEATVDAARRTPNPSFATAVLKQAIKREDLDWPEKLVQTYIAHCEDYEDADELQLAVIETRKAVRAVTARREREAREAAAAQQQQQEQQQQQWEAAAEAASTSEKRKREDEKDANGQPTSKKVRAEEVAQEQEVVETQPPVRDREHATVVVKNLPRETTEHNVRQFFRHIGTINGVKMLPGQDGNSEVAVIEFETKDEALAALTRDQKTFNENTIEVTLESESTLWVTNFPPTADEEYIRNLFSKYGHIVDIRFPSLKFQTSRRFCYVQFATASAAHQATELSGTEIEKGYKIVAKISDPSQKEKRSGALHEGREIFCKSFDWKLKESDARDAFSKFGTIENLHLPLNADGSHRGYFFVAYSSKVCVYLHKFVRTLVLVDSNKFLQEEAEAALAMDKQTLGRRQLAVSLSGNTGAKRIASTIISRVASSASPPAEANGNTSGVVETVGGRSERTLALMNVPDTVNDARVRALVEPFGRLVKIVLRPDHQGAIVEYVDVHDAGKASLALEGKEIAPGRPLHIGSVDEMKKMQAEKKTDRVTSIKPEKPKPSLQPAGPIKRPQQPGARGGRRGGLGLKRAPVAPRNSTASGAASDKDKMDTTADSKGGESVPSKKSNDDFRAMLGQKRTE
jgi:RNA recognition motif-containing protein